MKKTKKKKKRRRRTKSRKQRETKKKVRAGLVVVRVAFETNRLADERKIGRKRRDEGIHNILLLVDKPGRTHKLGELAIFQLELCEKGEREARKDC